MITLPFGQPVEYLLPVSMRSGKLQDHSRLCMYCGPDLSAENKGSIIRWNPKTLRFVSQSTYKILPCNCISYDWKPLDPGNFIHSKPDNNVDQTVPNNKLTKLLNLLFLYLQLYLTTSLNSNVQLQRVKESKIEIPNSNTTTNTTSHTNTTTRSRGYWKAFSIYYSFRV